MESLRIPPGWLGDDVFKMSFNVSVAHYAALDPARFNLRTLPRLAYALLCMSLGALICVFAENIWIALFGVWTMAGARGAFLPAVQAIQHDGFPERVRTTGLSVVNFSTEAIFAASYFLSAAFVDSIPVSSAWGIAAGSFILASIICLAVGKIENLR